jgi:hypothetical protein
MKVILAQSKNKQASQAVADIKKIFTESNPNIKLINFFCYSIYNSEELITAFNTEFPNIPVIGCSSAGEIIDGKLWNGTLVASAYTDEVIDDVKIEILDNINNNFCLTQMIDSFEKYFNSKFRELDVKKYFALTYIDGMSIKEETILDEVGYRTNIAFVGGSAGDDCVFRKTIVFGNGKFATNGIVVAVVKSKVNFAVYKSQAFLSTEHKVTATKVDEAKRIIYELDNRPAIDVYCEKLGIDKNIISEQELTNIFNSHPLGLIVLGQPFVRTIRGIVEDNALSLACNVKEGLVLNVLDSKSIVEQTQEDIDLIKKRHPTISNIIIFNCIVRYFELSANNDVEKYGNVFSDLPVIGLNTYGEAMIGYINQTAVFLVLE